MRIKLLAFLTTLTFTAAVVLSAWGGTAAPPAAPSLSDEDLTATACAPATSFFGYMLYGSPTFTPVPPDAEPTPTFVGSAASGETLFHTTAACGACHSTDDDQWQVGPPLRGISDRAAAKASTGQAQDYLRAVILSPDENILPQAVPGIMPRSYRYTLTAQQIEDIIAYVMTLE